MSAAPSRRFSVNGISLDRAPQYLKPYLDCVDGVMSCGGTTAHGKIITTDWALYRGGERIGRISIDMAGLTL